jgi:hypothetical protein
MARRLKKQKKNIDDLLIQKIEMKNKRQKDMKRSIGKDMIKDRGGLIFR